MEWISVNERLPVYESRILLLEVKPNKNGTYIYIGQRMSTYKFGEVYELDGKAVFFGKITHWMPLPEPPKE